MAPTVSSGASLVLYPCWRLVWCVVIESELMDAPRTNLWERKGRNLGRLKITCGGVILQVPAPHLRDALAFGGGVPGTAPSLPLLGEMTVQYLWWITLVHAQSWTYLWSAGTKNDVHLTLTNLDFTKGTGPNSSLGQCGIGDY